QILAQLPTVDESSWERFSKLESDRAFGKQISAEDLQLLKAWQSKIFQRRVDEAIQRERSTVWSVSSIALAALAWLLIFLGIAGMLAARFFKDDRPTTAQLMGTPTAVAIVIAVLALTVGLFGYVPAYQPHIGECPWPVIAVASTLVVAILGLIAWNLVRVLLSQRGLPREGRTWSYKISWWTLVVGGSFAFVVVTFVAIDARFRQFAIRFALRLPTSLYSSYDWREHAVDWRIGFRAETPSGTFAEWGAHYGVYVTAL